MNQNSSIKDKVDDRLHRIANVLLLNASFIDNIGLLNGKMGIALFFYQYARYTSNKIFEEYAGELIDEIYAEININTPVDFANGLTGVGWGIEYLVKNSFIDANTDEALEEVDNAVSRNSLNRPFLLDNGDDLFCFGLYYIVRLRGHENDEDNLKTLFNKQLLIYLVDDCERILVQKQYLDFNIQSLSMDTFISLGWFLLEMRRVGLFPVKVEKVFQSLPEHIDLLIMDPSDGSGQFQLSRLIESVIILVQDVDTKNKLKTILQKNNNRISNTDTSDDILVTTFIKSAWQQIVFETYMATSKQSLSIAEEVFSIIDHKDNWNSRLDNLNKNNLGMTGLTGLGLGLLRAKNTELTTSKQMKPKHQE